MRNKECSKKKRQNKQGSRSIKKGNKKKKKKSYPYTFALQGYKKNLSSNEKEERKPRSGIVNVLFFDEANSERVKISLHSPSPYRYSDVLCEHARALEKTLWQEKREREGERKKFMLATHALDRETSTSTIRIVR
jgi:hypothetical protein